MGHKKIIEVVYQYKLMYYNKECLCPIAMIVPANLPDDSDIIIGEDDTQGLIYLN